MKKFRILIVSQYFWPENFKINDFAFHFSQKGHDVDVLTGYPNYPSGKYFKGYGLFKNKKNKEVIKDVNIFRAPLIPRGKSNKLRLILNYTSFVFFASLKGLFLKKKYDFIFIYEPSPVTVAIPAILIKKLKRIPVIFWVTDLWPESIIATLRPSSLNKKIINGLINPIVKWIYNESDKILVTSKGFVNSIREKIGKSKDIEFFPQWAESIFRPISNKNISFLNEIPKNSFKIMFAGNLGEAQDFPSIIKCASLLKRHKNIQWIIIGDGRKKSWIESQIKINNLQSCFHLLGSFPVEKMPQFYSAADTLLFSLKDDFIFSITIPAKVQSYLACGKPIIGMVNGESQKLINNSKSGFCCHSGDFKNLSKKILELSKMNKIQINELGKNALSLYKRSFDRNVIFNRAEEIFNEITKLNNE